MDKNTNGGVCMEKKSNNKAINFFKKEGFYVILFVCLCIVASVASITASNNKKVVSNQNAIQKEQENAQQVLQEQEKQYQGALQVKKENLAKSEVLKPVPNIKKVTTENLTAPVSKSVNATFAKPVVNGLLARAYSKDISTVVYLTDNTNRTNLGIDIQAKTGEPVVSVMDGVVKQAGTDLDDQNGYIVTIDHGNGFTTKYSNLQQKMLVKVNDKVTKKQQIGTVGNTSLNSCNEVYGPHLHFEVLQSNKLIDPAKYVKYDKYQALATKK